MARLQVRTPAGWTYIERRGDREAADVRPLAIASARLDAARFVTAVVTEAKSYKVLLWELAYDGSVKLLDAADGGPTTRIAVANMPNTVQKFGHASFVTAARTEAGTLKVTAWDVDAAGGLTRRGSRETGEIHGEFALASAFGLTFVTACRDSDDRLTLISWWRTTTGSIERLQTVRGEEVREIALATYDTYPPAAFPVVTAVTTPGRRTTTTLLTTNFLKLIAWRVDEAGAFTRLGEAKGGAARGVVAASLSHRRIVTAARGLEDAFEVRTWDFDAQGQIAEHASGTIDKIGDGDFGLATRCAARVVTAVPDDGGRLTLVSWDGVDDVVRLGHARAGQADLLTVVSLGSDWLATPVRTATGTLKVIMWLEHGVSLLRGEWSGIPVAPTPEDGSVTLARKTIVGDDLAMRHVEPDLILEEKSEDDGSARSPVVSDVYVPRVEGLDAMVSVGFNFVIVSQDHKIGFFDKQMNRLGSVTSQEFFDTFLRRTNADGSPNEDCINRHLGFEPGSALNNYPPGAMVYCDPDATGKRPVCISGGDAFFDIRSHFDHVSGRFFVAAGVRPGCKNVLPATGECTDNDDPKGKNTNKADNPLVRRYFAFAISKSEDPRAGFYQWITTEAGRTYDHPLTAVNKQVMVLTAGPSADTLRTHPFGMKPKVFVFSVEDMLLGSRYLRSHKILPTDILIPIESRLIPLRHYGETGGRTFFVRPVATKLDKQNSVFSSVFVFSFKHPSDWTQFPPMEVAASKSVLDFEVGAPDDTGFFRDGKIYFAWHKAHPQVIDTNGDGKIDEFDQTRYSIRLVCLPLLDLATKPVPSVASADGFFYRVFGIRSNSDGPNDLVSYVRPDAVVSRDGHVVVSFARVGYNVALAPEARYKVFYADARGVSGSQLLKPGEYLPSEPPDSYLDYQTSAIDPSDDRTVWMMSVFADEDPRDVSNNRYRAVVAKLVP